MCVFLIVMNLTVFSCIPNNMAFDPSCFQSITLYDLDAFEYDSLSNGTSVELSDELTKQIFGNSTFCAGEVLWKGNLLGVVKLDTGKECRIAISYYGGYFKILGQSGYYKMSEKEFKKFERVFADILENTFIPARRQRQEMGN